MLVLALCLVTLSIENVQVKQQLPISSFEWLRAILLNCCVQSTSNYVARRYGVRAAMPGFIGQKLCPELIIIPPNFDKYTAMSEQVRCVFAEYDPNYSAASLDEAYLDITEHLERRHFASDDERTFPGYMHPELVCRCMPNSGTYTYYGGLKVTLPVYHALVSYW